MRSLASAVFLFCALTASASAASPPRCDVAPEVLRGAGGAPIRALHVEGERWIAATDRGELITGAPGEKTARGRTGARVVAVRFLPEPSRALALDDAGVLHLLELDELVPLRRWGDAKREKPVTSFAPGPDGTVAVGRKNGALELWQMDAKRPLWTTRLRGTLSYSGGGPLAPVSGIGFSDDGRYLAGGQALHLSTARAQDGKVLTTQKLPSKTPITHVTFFSEGARVGALTYTGFAWFPAQDGRLGMRWYEATAVGFAREPFAASEQGRIVTSCRGCAFAGEPRQPGARTELVVADPPSANSQPPDDVDPRDMPFRRALNLTGLLVRDREGVPPGEASVLALSRDGRVLVVGYSNGAVLRCGVELTSEVPANGGARR